MNWGQSILLSFLLFAVLMVTMVAICVRQDIGLVSKNYYAEELAYQDQINRIQNTNRLTRKPVISLTGSTIQVVFDPLLKMEGGDLTIYRASSAQLDRHFRLRVSSTRQHFELGEMPRGVYHVKMRWHTGGKGFYIEQEIRI